MIGKICPRGQDVAGLIRYLYGPGRREEHTDPHIIAGYRPPPDLEPPLRANGSRDFRRLAGLLRLPHDVLGKWGYARPVWHCPMRTAPEDRMLSDREWAQIAEDVIHRTGLCPRGEEDEAARWIAIRHGPDHIHLVAMLARQDRTRPRIANERYRVRDACLAAEQRYRLRSTAPADRTAARSPSRAETGKAARYGRGEPARTRPAPAATATSATAAAATGTHPLTSTEAYSCSTARSRSGAAPGEILVPQLALPTRPGRGHPRGSHRSSSRWYRRYPSRSRRPAGCLARPAERQPETRCASLPGFLTAKTWFRVREDATSAGPPARRQMS